MNLLIIGSPVDSTGISAESNNLTHTFICFSKHWSLNPNFNDEIVGISGSHLCFCAYSSGPLLHGEAGDQQRCKYYVVSSSSIISVIIQNKPKISKWNHLWTHSDTYQSLNFKTAIQSPCGSPVVSQEAWMWKNSFMDATLHPVLISLLIFPMRYPVTLERVGKCIFPCLSQSSQETGSFSVLTCCYSALLWAAQPSLITER